MTWIDHKTQEIVLPTKEEWEEAQSRKSAILRYLCELEDVPYPVVNEQSPRIEQFLNAIYLGETIDLVPQSRIEILLKAIMDGEDIDVPTYSRSEVLLMKIIKGDTDLSDIEPLQSRYEVYLAYLVLNGGMGGQKWIDTDSFIACEDGTYLLDVNGQQIKLEKLLVE